MNLRCLFRHSSSVIVGETVALTGCVRCGAVESVWRVVRPEQAIAAQRQHEAIIRDRERRVARMTERPKVVRFK